MMNSVVACGIERVSDPKSPGSAGRFGGGRRAALVVLVVVREELHQPRHLATHDLSRLLDHHLQLTTAAILATVTCDGPAHGDELASVERHLRGNHDVLVEEDERKIAIAGAREHHPRRAAIAELHL